MTWWKNGLLLAAGGVAGLALAAWLESESEACARNGSHKVPGVDGIELLVENVRKDAEWAMAECTTDEEREKVYAEVTDSIKELQATLQKRGDEIIADLKKQVCNDAALNELEAGNDDAVTKFKSSMEDLTKTLDETLASLKPEPMI
ncbi:hypothetical protein SELR_13710 [Selenomonas ruminantium subsp. lactilytica TAM6421]|uniref:Gas vesicle protein n=1 Tax=Selenomonas ruminantium subsp. lactilytica (strain NBRC 103574 / TAM6421) TaxID=927704 RepID=I0GQP2_SELRL|nr:hypothetical protein [Selenomonas ruminantium]BAL83079.1 hypothetical protein SELR_13710 [Selenomonas ruminantium subsp. lactilytica TAM6421]